MIDSEEFLGVGLVEAGGGLGDHFLFGVGNGAGFRGETFDGGIVAVGGNERGEGFDKMPYGAVEARLVAGGHVFASAADPLPSAGDALEFHDTFGPHSDGDITIGAA